MSLNKNLFIACQLFLISSAFAQSSPTGSSNMTLSEYTAILAAKLKNADKAEMPAAKDPATPAVLPKQEWINPFANWIYNGATLDKTGSILYGELIINNRSRLVYDAETIAPSWRVIKLTGRAIEFQNTACLKSTQATHKSKKSEEICQYRLNRKS